MSNNELVFATMFLVFLPIILLRMTLTYRERSRKALRDKGLQDNSLTTAELEVIIEDAVRRGTGGLEDRLDRLEHAVFGEGTVDATRPLVEYDAVEPEDVPRIIGRPERQRVR